MVVVEAPEDTLDRRRQRGRGGTNVSDEHMSNKNTQEQPRGELTESPVHVSKGTLVGHVHVEVEARMLMAFLQNIEQQKVGTSWIQEKEKMKKEICELKAQLAQHRRSSLLDVVPTTLTPDKEKMKEICELKALLAQTKQETLEEVEGLEAQKEAFNETLRELQTSLGQETSSSADLQEQLDQIRVENEHLEEDLQQERTSIEALLEELKKEDALKAAQEEAELQFNTSRLDCQEESPMKDREEMMKTSKEREEEETYQSQQTEEKPSLLQETKEQNEKPEEVEVQKKKNRKKKKKKK